MKSFFTVDGDVVVEKTIKMVDGSELLRQKVERVLSTNLGEWSYDMEEGINFRAILVKNPDESEIRATIEAALIHIDESFMLTDFNLEMLDHRKAEISFHAVNGNGEEVGGVYTYGG